MQHINDIAQEILKAEDGFVNDPDDPGGPTNYGVTLKTLKQLGHDLNQDGRIDIADFKQLSATQVVQIFVQDYFNKPQIDQLPHMLHAPVFDMYVNAFHSAGTPPMVVCFRAPAATRNRRSVSEINPPRAINADPNQIQFAMGLM